MEHFKKELEALRDALKASASEEDANKAWEDLKKNTFGERFPVPPKKDTAKPGGGTITSSGVSA